MQQEGVQMIQQPVQQQQVIIVPREEEVVFLRTDPVQQQQQQNQIIIIDPVESTPQQRATKVNYGDDPTCIYIAAFTSLFIPFIGFIVLCCYACSNNLGPRQRRAFHTLIICIIIGVILDIIFGYYWR